MKKKDLLPVSIVLFSASLFLPVAASLQVISMGLLILAALLQNNIRQKIVLFKQRPAIWFILAFAVLLLLSLAASDNKTAGWRFLELRLPLLLFPLSIGLLSITKKQRDSILLSIAIIVSLACLLTFCLSIRRYWLTHDPAWLYNDSLSSFIGQQSIYTALLVTISIYIFTYFMRYGALSLSRKRWMGIAILFLFVMNYLLASRNMMILLYLSVLFFAFYFILKRRNYLAGIGLLAVILLGGFLVMTFFPKTLNRFKELAFTHYNYKSQAAESHYAGVLTPDQWNGANFRLAAWHCGWQLVREHPITGTGLGDKRDELYRVYRQKGFQFAIDTGKNVHCNYLDIFYSLGITGLLLFLAGWTVLPARRFLQQKDLLAGIILLSFALAMITENYFDRSLGAMLFGFFIPFLLCAGPDRSASSAT